MKGILITAIALLSLGAPSLASAQAQRSQDFKNKYKLKEAVVLSRHNIRIGNHDGPVFPQMARRRRHVP